MIKLFKYISFFALTFFIEHIETGCANMIPPSGGPRDSIPPKLFAALPKDSAMNVTTNKITLVFDEYIDGKDIQKNLIVSPYPKNAPIIENKLRNVTIKLKDTLEANTTYSLNFGDGIKDVNEGNIAKNFKYVFSTGKTIDQNTFSGNVILAETGKLDTTLIVVLHRNLADTSIYKNRPRYYTRLDSKGKFVFSNLPE
ncbi:MAG: Ig-like domain-containing protein, partial [Bacteroidota bacterium]|nr:Ig-like domain-containing protein [Bacteroidota bacterium]